MTLIFSRALSRQQKREAFKFFMENYHAAPNLGCPVQIDYVTALGPTIAERLYNDWGIWLVGKDDGKIIVSVYFDPRPSSFERGDERDECVVQLRAVAMSEDYDEIKLAKSIGTGMISTRIIEPGQKVWHEVITEGTGALPFVTRHWPSDGSVPGLSVVIEVPEFSADSLNVPRK